MVVEPRRGRVASSWWWSHVAVVEPRRVRGTT